MYLEPKQLAMLPQNNTRTVRLGIGKVQGRDSLLRSTSGCSDINWRSEIALKRIFLQVYTPNYSRDGTLSKISRFLQLHAWWRKSLGGRYI